MATLQEAWAATEGPVAERLADLQARVVSVARVVRWREVRALALAHGRWARLVVRARQTPAIPPATEADAAILAAINATSMADDQELDPGPSAEASAFQAGLAALVAVGDVTPDLAAAIGALFIAEAPEFPGVGLPDLHAAGLISAAEAGVEG